MKDPMTKFTSNVDDSEIEQKSNKSWDAEAYEKHLELLRKRALLEIGETGEMFLKEKLTEFRQAIRENPKKIKEPGKNLDDYLLPFLRAAKFNIPKAVLKYKKYCQIQHNNMDIAEIVAVGDMATYGKLVRENVVCALKRRDAFGRAILLLKCQGWDANEFSLEEVLSILLMVVYSSAKELDTQLHGVVTIIDLKGLNLSHVGKITRNPLRLVNILHFMQGSFPIKIKQMNLVNHPRIFNAVYSMAKPLLNKKMRERLFFHGDDLKSLGKNIDPTLLPDFLGGNLNNDEYAESSYHDLIISHKILNKEIVKNLCFKEDYKRICQF